MWVEKLMLFRFCCYGGGGKSLINVIYHAALKRNSSNYKGLVTKKIVYTQGLTIKQLIEFFNLDEVGLIIINGKLTHEECVLADDDNVEFHPFVGGG